MQALSLNRVPHLRGVGRLTGKHAAGRRRYDEEMGEGAYADGASGGACEVEVTFTGGRAEGDKVVLSSDNVLLATGSKALQLPTLDGWYDQPVGGHVRCYDSDSIKRLSFLPRSVVVVGGGIIAVEFARIFAALDAEVTMLVRASDLPKSLSRVGIDRQMGFLLQAELIASGVKLQFESEVSGASAVVGSEAVGGQRKPGRRSNRPEQLQIEVVRAGTSEAQPPLTTDLVLTATGRKAITDGLGLEELGIELKPNGDVEVGSTLMTSAEGVYAAGDLIGAPQLASTGIEQAEAAVDAMLGRSAATVASESAAGLVTRDCSPTALLSNAARYPIGIWTLPELAFVGLTAAAASAAPHNLDVIEGIGRYSESIRGHVHTVGTECEGEYLGGYLADESCEAEAEAEAQAEALLTGPALKLVVERCEPHRVVGVHILGDNACELIHFGTTLVQGGKTLTDILAVCYAAVTYHELYKLAARDAIATLQKDAWRELYRRLDAAGDNNGTLEAEEVRLGLIELGADEEAISDILKALFTGRDASRMAVGMEQFVKRAMRMRSPMQMGLLGTCA